MMMGTLTFDLDDVVTKTTGGLIVLPRDHYLMTRRTRSHTGDASHRQIGVRPVQLLHRVLPALSAGLRRAAAQSDAQPGLHH
jgi:Na+-translocating ferredoxin:NAD+ oxidoreductase RnfC subunit